MQKCQGLANQGAGASTRTTGEEVQELWWFMPGEAGCRSLRRYVPGPPLSAPEVCRVYGEESGKSQRMGGRAWGAKVMGGIRRACYVVVVRGQAE